MSNAFATSLLLYVQCSGLCLPLSPTLKRYLQYHTRHQTHQNDRRSQHCRLELYCSAIKIHTLTSAATTNFTRQHLSLTRQTSSLHIPRHC